METRRRSNFRASLEIGGLVTKKDRESLEKPVTCPPILRKSLRCNSFSKSDDSVAVPLSCTKKACLDPSYDETVEMPYIYQVFNVIGKVGEGCFGTVYKATAKQDGSVYALKISKPRGVKEMIKEVKKLEKIGDHPNCTKYYFAWKEMGNVFIQLEYCVTSLTIYSGYNHKIKEMELWEIFLDIILALRYLHDKGFVHLDVKPDNILIGLDGSYKLGDFGLLVDLLEINENYQARCEISEGDARYLAREVLEGNYTPAGDIFGLGITILELSADLVLPSNGQLWHSLRNGDIPANYLSVVPDSLQRLICQLMCPLFNKRPTANQILGWRDIKKRLHKRDLKSRVNYYQNWLASRDPNDPIIKIFEPVNSPLKPLVFAKKLGRNNNNNNFDFPIRKIPKLCLIDALDKDDKKTPLTSRKLKFEMEDSRDVASLQQVDETPTKSKYLDEEVTMDIDVSPIASTTPPFKPKNIPLITIEDVSRGENDEEMSSYTTPKRVPKLMLYSV